MKEFRDFEFAICDLEWKVSSFPVESQGVLVNETELIIDGRILEEKLVEPLRQEACELTAIMAASRRSAMCRPIADRKSKIANP